MLAITILCDQTNERNSEQDISRIPWTLKTVLSLYVNNEHIKNNGSNFFLSFGYIITFLCAEPGL